MTAHVIVFGCEKGGSGKSTVAMHVFTALAREGARVGAIDLDTRQRSFFRYLENRARTKAQHRYTEAELPMPEMREIAYLEGLHRGRPEDVLLERFLAAVEDLSPRCDYLLIDCPGTDSYLSRLGHAAGDTVITPLNDSYIDLDLLGLWDGRTQKFVKLSVYTEVVLEAKRLRAENRLPPLDWIVMRNRFSGAATSWSTIEQGLQAMAPRAGFRIAKGFAERSIYRDLWQAGLTVHDLAAPANDPALRSGYEAAQREVADLITRLELPRADAA